MPDIIIYHNGTCTKSKGALELLQDAAIPHTIRYYLAEPLNENELAELLAKLDMQPSELVRKNEPLFKVQFEGKKLSETDWFRILIENPILIERPIVENGDHALIARPAERVFELL